MGPRYRPMDVIRTAKNLTMGYSDIVRKVRKATSNKHGEPQPSLMSEIAIASFRRNNFVEILSVLEKRLNDKGKNWRHVYKALVLFEYLIRYGDQEFVVYLKDRIFMLKTLYQFQYLDDTGRDRGMNVRNRSKELVSCLEDTTKLYEERNAINGGVVFQGDGSRTSGSYVSSSYTESYRSDGLSSARPSEQDVEEMERQDLLRAIKESKESEERRMRREIQTESETDLAIRLSKMDHGSPRMSASNMDASPPMGTKKGGVNEDLIDLFGTSETRVRVPGRDHSPHSHPRSGEYQNPSLSPRHSYSPGYNMCPPGDYVSNSYQSPGHANPEIAPGYYVTNSSISSQGFSGHNLAYDGSNQDARSNNRGVYMGTSNGSASRMSTDGRPTNTSWSYLVGSKRQDPHQKPKDNDKFGELTKNMENIDNSLGRCDLSGMKAKSSDENEDSLI